MTIPIVPLSKKNEPDMLLYALGSFDTVEPQISDKLGSLKRRFMLLADTSGAGKTRFIFEYLACVEWGFYFTFEVDPVTSPYGSADLTDAIVLMHDQRFRHADQQPFVPVVEHSDVSDEDSVEKRRARWAFCKAVRNSGEVNRATLQRTWCLLQVAPHLSGLGDIFLRMFRAVRLVDTKVAQNLITNLVRQLRAAGFPSLRTLAVDEAQSGTRTFSTCFGPNPKSQATEFEKMTRPVLKPFVEAVFKRGKFNRLIASGTKIDQDAVLEALSSTVAKQGSLDRDVAPLLGQNDDEARIHSVLDIFFGDGFSGRLPSATQREISFGCRDVMVYVLLQAGPSEDNVYDILMDLVSKLSGHDIRRPDGPTFRSIDVNNIIPKIIRAPETPETMRVRDLETVLVNFLITRRYDRHQHCDTLEKLVEIGIGRFAKPFAGKQVIKVIFNENLILIALWAWFRLAPPGGKSRLHRYLQLGKAAANPAIAGFGWEDVVAYMLCRWFVGAQPVQLNTVFDFFGREPTWATDTASLVQTLLEDQSSDAKTAGKITAVLASTGTTLGLSYQTSKPEQTFKAIQPRLLEEDTGGIFQQRGYAFIKPDESMGPDLLAIARLSDGTLLLIVVQCKDLNRQLSVTEILKNLDKLAPHEKGWWFKNGARSQKCKEYVEAIEKLFPVRGTRYEATDADTPPTREVRPSTSNAYKGHPRCAVLRVIAARQLEDLGENARIGPWPAAKLSSAAMQCTAEEFDSVKVALQDAQDAQQVEIQEALKSHEARRSLATALLPVPTRTPIRRLLKLRTTEQVSLAASISQSIQTLNKRIGKAAPSRSGHAKSRSFSKRGTRSRSASSAPSDSMSISDDARLSDDMNAIDHPPASDDGGLSDDMSLGDEIGFAAYDDPCQPSSSKLSQG
ncbi:hypothetical protein BKA62DRAFT_818341 [Auriculariales sp. MPI-PUGE-AT-0066]|nr:hypothetical protein BKA62DRAFT_818341 [Auriculariales sp. MPI-PUGE-AT-0066]